MISIVKSYLVFEETNNMGIYGRYTGTMDIREEEKQKFTENVLKLLNYGGMVQFDQVSMYGMEIALMKPLEVNQEGKACFHYNYFEEDAWEDAGYNAETGKFYSNKIGGDEFCDVITAIHVLYELYDNNVGFAEINGEVVDWSGYVGWINHVLGTKYSMKKRFNLWENFETYCLKRLEVGCGEVNRFCDVLNFVPCELQWAAGGTELTDICYLLEGTESLQKEDIVSGSYPEAVYECKQALLRYYEKDDETYNSFGDICELIKLDRAKRENIQEERLKEIAKFSLKLPARVLLYLSVEILKKSFWEVWKELREEAYTDEQMHEYACDELQKLRRELIETPIPAMSTSEFLYNDGPFTFWDTPEELQGKPNYYITDDDRAFWWGGTKEVQLSESMEQWLEELAECHKQIMQEISDEPVDANAFLKLFIEILAEADSYYKRIFCFQNMFYEFLQSGWTKEYVAAIRLFQKLMEDNREDGKIIEKARNKWDMVSRNVTHNIGRLRLKRYLATMANVKLRKRYFGF